MAIDNVEVHDIKDVEIGRGYLGNPNIKRVGVDIPWSKEMVEEWIKCSQSPKYFIENYVRIVHVDHGLVPFNLRDYQHQMVDSMVNHRRTIIATARQTGKSTTTVAFLLWYILFNNDKTVALLANKADTAREILGRVQLAYEHLPKWLQQGVVEWNKSTIDLENNSRIVAAATSGSAIRGYSINVLFIDEAAFIDNWDDFFTSVFPTISSGETTKIILVSTPNGLNHFYKTWTNANKGRNGYNPIKVMWYEVPGRDEKWKQEILDGMDGDIEKFEQEHEVSFLGTSGTLIAGSSLKELVFQDPIVDKDGLRIYEAPIKGNTSAGDHRYALIADTSRGKGLDYHAFSVFDISKMPYNQVCTFNDNLLTPQDYASMINRIGRYYNDAMALIEINDLGQQVADVLWDTYEYDNILYTRNNGRAGKEITFGFGGKNTDRGVRTTKTVKNNGCSLLKLLIEQKQMILNDYETIQQISTFSKKAGSWEAEQGKHDDLVTGLWLFAWLSAQKNFKEMTDVNTLAGIREMTEEQMMDQLTPFGIIDDGRPEPDEMEFIDLTDPEQRWIMGDF